VEEDDAGLQVVLNALWYLSILSKRRKEGCGEENEWERRRGGPGAAVNF
jgi:hypothetical protein